MYSENYLIKAKSQLTLKHPYFGMLASRLKHESSEKTTTYASNGKRFLYNPEFMAQRNLDEIMFILTNCVMHHVLSHQQRRLNRRGSLWQLATDYAINNLLHENGLEIPQGANYNNDYKGMFAEEIYEVLKEEYFGDIADAYDNENVEANTKNDTHTFSNLQNIKEELDPEDESQWNYAESVTQELAQRKSAMPAGLNRLAQKVKANDIDWRF
jgi:predicted metal-dependent peptidase